VSDNYHKDPRLFSRLTSKQYRVTQQGATESAFNNEYWDNKEPGISVGIVSGEPLLASVSKYDSRTGWASFTVSIEPGNVTESQDTRHGMIRTEVRSTHGLGLDIDPGSTAERRAIEVYPHPAIVVLFGLPSVLRYKAKPAVMWHCCAEN
jgi:methionine-R-sulfoxide reductase